MKEENSGKEGNPREGEKRRVRGCQFRPPL